MRAYIDSDILIWHLRGEKKACNLIKTIRDEFEHDLWVGALQRAEVVFFMRPEEEENTYLFLSEFKTALVDQTIVDTAGGFYRKWHHSHGIDINDAFLAAIVSKTGGGIYTLNTKHFPMPGLIVKKGW
jgi:predicted nucleic acid-binding protein